MSIIDTEKKWIQYCKKNNIKNPFDDRGDLKPTTFYVDGIRVKGYEYTAPEIDEKERQEYLRLKDKFFAWEMHFWVNDWEKFTKMCNAEGYFPCDLAGRQCYMACEYFGKKCPREDEELKCPI